MKYFVFSLIISMVCAQANLCNSTLPGCSLCSKSTNVCLSCNPNYIFINNSCLQCAVGQYSLGGNTTNCNACSVGCSNCNATQCISCFPDFEMDNGSCFSCPTSTFSPGGTSNCIECTNSCLDCYYDTISEQVICSSCLANYGLQYGSCVQCSTGEYSDGGNISCISCPVGCSACFGTSNSSFPICSNCSSSYGYLNGSCNLCPNGQVSTGGQDVCCPLGCSSCNVSECISCSANFYFTANGCLQCPNSTYSQGGNPSNCINCSPGCLICNSSGCLNCQSGFTLSQTRDCIQCNIYFCSYCSSLDVCKKCQGNYSLVTLSGFLPVCSCPNPFTVNIAGQCVCLSPLIYNGSACLCTEPNCLACNSQDECENCTAGYTVVGGNCYLSCTILNCQSCETYNECVQCSNGMVPSGDSTSCLYCNVTGCSFCQESNNCSVCSAQLVLTVINNISYCLICTVENCIACSDNNICMTCGSGYILNNGTCVLCLFPCARLNANGTCSSCIFPFNFAPFSNGTCFICNVPNCANCTNASAEQCFICSPPFSLTSAMQCQSSCAAYCVSCNQTNCSLCASFYYLANNSCSICPNAPQCSVCNSSNIQQCLNCTAGFFNSNGTCLPCAIYCQKCANESYCYTLIETYSVGFVLASLNSNSNVIAACDPGCQTCQSSNPAFCLACLHGYYFISSGICALCTIQSYCMQCVSNSPSTCLSCYPGSFLNRNQTCSQCSLNCSTCNNGDQSQCTSCHIGFFLLNGSCFDAVQTVCGGYCSDCLNAEELSCSACVEGAILLNGNCVPCQAGCGVCSSSNLSVCLICASGYFTNTTGGCSPCPSNCLTCNSFGCTSCSQFYILNSSFICTQKCSFPCVQCASDNKSICIQCVYGYILSGGLCSAETCSSLQNCTYCPLNTLMIIESTLAVFSQSCIPCAGLCARCDQTIHVSCISCFPQYYLSDSKCSSCVSPCLTCVTQQICTSCLTTFVALQGVDTNPPYVICIPCSAPCQNCIQTPQVCTSCVSNFTFVGTQCVSFFNFQVQVVFNTDSSSFNQNYFAFLNAISNAAQVPMTSVTVLSVVYGSVTITLLVSTNNLPASSEAIAQQNALQLLLAEPIAGIPVQSSSVTTNGGSNNSDDENNNSNKGSGLSKTAIIIIAVFVPLISLRTFVIS